MRIPLVGLKLREAGTHRTGAAARRNHWLRWPLRITIGFLISASLAFVFVFRPNFTNSKEIPNGWGRSRQTVYYGKPAVARPLGTVSIPAHPFLATSNSSNMHVDAFASDVHPKGGPLGRNMRVRTYAHGRIGGECATVTFDSRGNIVAVCATFRKFSLLVISPETMRPLAEFRLPPRESNKSLNIRKIMLDTSGGAYFFLDNHDHAVLVDANQQLRVIGQRWSGERVALVVEQEFDLAPTLRLHTGPQDAVTAVLPDWGGTYWFVSRQGLIGTVQPESGRIAVLELHNEEIQNSFAVDEDGVYVVSDYALYGLTADTVTGRPVIRWREPYERAERPKLGSISLGSGTTPTLLSNGYVAIADNATPQINALIYKRSFDPSGERLVCKVPLFSPGRSVTENSFIGFGNSIVIENNYGYDLFVNMIFGRTGAGGLMRIDVSEGGECETKWQNPIVSQTTVAKLSQETGLIYVYAKDPDAGWGVDAYYLAAIDFRSGETVFQQLTGTGMPYDNNWAPITIGPDACVYAGTLRGLVQVCDQ